jgi:ribosome maturation protein SDO1
MSGKHTTARFQRGNEQFEILVKPDQALNYHLGKTSSLAGILVTETIFSDASKGIKVSDESLRKTFSTTEILKVAEIILKKGTIQLTTEQRRKMTNEKKRQIITFISRQCLDPRTNLPHPPTRIEQAVEQIHYSIDPFGSEEKQAKEIIKLLQPILPLKMEQLSISVHITAQYAARAYGKVKEFGTIKHEEWRGDGSWYAIIEMPAGLYYSFIERIGNITKGNAVVKTES